MAERERKNNGSEPPIRPVGLDTASIYERAAELIAEGDRTIAEAMNAAVQLEAEILDRDSAFMKYVRETQERAISAVKMLVGVDPKETEKIVGIQFAISDYLRVLEFAAKIYQGIGEGPENDFVEDEDRLDEEPDHID